ncbi:hypothetical protein [Saccharopolyspora sp. SCSIO 74807]|uniref:helix-turn-helix domain-containing protein n=1 Tax=Saccharopolyspora sp. SCSIO 74807 TaxID=3118084 RepID=UPI0030CBF0C5
MPGEEIPPEFWRCPQVRDALAAHDIGSVYRALRTHGVPQIRIAALTGQAQSEVSEVLSGRAVRSYDLLSRIAEGLGVPRGWMGLAYAGGDEQAPDAEEEEEQVKRRSFLSYAGSVVVGGQTDAGPPGVRDLTAHSAAPTRVGASDLAAMQRMITELRTLDQRYGGVGQYGTIAASARQAEAMREACMSEQVRADLMAMLCNLHATAGWIAAENGLLQAAHGHYGRALSFGREGTDPLAISRALYAAGRTELHFGDAESALKLFQLGSLRTDSSPLVSSVLQLNCAWAAAFGQRKNTVQRALEQGRSQHAAASIDDDYPLLRWFREADLLGMTGSVQLAMGDHEGAAGNLSRAVAARAPGEVRSTVFELASLGEAKFALGDHAAGFRHGRRAVLLASRVRSARLRGRLAGLRAWSAQLADRQHAARDDAAELLTRIDRLAGVQG